MLDFNTGWDNIQPNTANKDFWSLDDDLINEEG